MFAICIILAMMGSRVCQSDVELSGRQSGGKSCRTVGGPSRGADCQFPFTFGGVERRGCITDQDPGGALWCSTQTDRAGNHLTGSWAHCSPDCPVDSGGQVGACTTAAGRAGLCSPPALCVGVDFPNLDRDSCRLASGQAGLCCSPNTENRVAKISGAASPPDLNLPRIRTAELDTIFREVDAAAARPELNIRTGGTGLNSNKIPGQVTGKKVRNKYGSVQELVWFGCPGLYRFALVYFSLLCFSFVEFGILHTMDHGQTRKKKEFYLVWFGLVYSG